MFRVCNWDGISASRKASKSCFVKGGAGLVSGTGAEGTFAGGGEGSEINGDGAGPCPCAIAASPTTAANPTDGLCIGASLPVEALLTILRLRLPPVTKCVDSLLQFLKMRSRPVDLTATGAAPELVVVNPRQRFEL